VVTLNEELKSYKPNYFQASLQELSGMTNEVVREGRALSEYSLPRVRDHRILSPHFPDSTRGFTGRVWSYNLHVRLVVVFVTMPGWRKTSLKQLDILWHEHCIIVTI